MKFLCDRCKTRYSIGDDRVRGKILKIRCKNCANVITVREGMSEADAADSGADRRSRPTTAAPPAQSANAASSGALGAAFSAQMAKPPPALEEEWYVSIEGEQSGPFSLAEAQRWVAARPFDAELYCWSEGFDDWLPVDKVSHFRGLRKKPAPPAVPPPLPRSLPQRPEEEPKPLFAATMASLERSSGAVTVPPIATTPTGKTTPATVSAKTNGTSPTTAPISQRAPVLPSRKSPIPSIATTAKSGPAMGGVPQGKGSGPAKALAAAFDVHDDPAESMTAVDAPVFNDEIETRAEPAAAGKRMFDAVGDAAVTTPAMAKAGGDRRPELPMPFAKSAPIPQAIPAVSEQTADDGLDIGEVSRVVNLADLAKQMESRPARASRPALAGLRGTGSAPKFDPAALGLTNPAGVPNAEAGAGESLVVQQQVLQGHRRGMFILLGAAGLLLVGVIGAVVLISSDDNDAPMGLGHATIIDTSRPEDIARHNAAEAGSATTTTNKQVRHPWVPQNFRPQNTTEPELPSDPTKRSLDASEIEDMAQKQGEGTKRCYMRAQKGAMGFDIGDLKKIMVTLTVDREGTVTDVQLSDHGADTFGKCLVARIKGWKFRTSPGGIYKLALAFSSN